ncbi:winged helix-turn-helix transcriptional regulator [Saccharopolyspora indica]|uniref:winged helix-turn-helix transcriptional regulator n=1 Tax=Saccharopolyspora indica TaxID=1229659 RepID=UPI0022EA63C7|nr:winged helix-turn-helix transcriptional regulator [Saccharopolyspora indica]MDA3646976.1 winged helix-turn-helix transcriptional regulator [Saccharopolyspora indica]
MVDRSFGQFCGLARALELIGERWALLVVRDLVLGPKRYTELQRTLPKIPSSILSARLNELEDAGVVRRRVLAELDAGVVYELTEYGNELEPVILQLGLWGARSLGDPAPDQVFTLDSAILSLHTTFRPDAAIGVRVGYELRYGPFTVHALVDDGTLQVAEGPCPEPDLVIELCGSIKPLLSKEIGATEAVRSGLVRVEGDVELLSRFTELFHIPPAPVRLEKTLAVR